MKKKLNELSAPIHLIINKWVLPYMGMPLFVLGVLILAVMCVTHWWANWLIVMALVLEAVGAAVHFAKIKLK